MSPGAYLQTAEADLRIAARRYTQAQTRGDFIEAMLEFHAGLEKAFDAVLGLTPADEDVAFAEKARRVAPTYSQELRRLNSIRNDVAHKRRAVSDQEVLAASAGFALITSRVWSQLFGSNPPNMNRPAPGTYTPGTAASPSSQASPASPAQSAPTAETKSTRFRWQNLLGFIVLFLLTPWLAGVAYYLWDSGALPIYWPLLLSAIVIVLTYFTLRNAWLFVRAFGLLRLMGVVSALIVIASLAMIPIVYSPSGLAGRAGVAFSRVLEGFYAITVGVIPKQFATGQEIAAGLVGGQGNDSPPVSAPASAASEERPQSVAPTPSPRGAAATPTAIRSPAAEPTLAKPAASSQQIGIGMTVVVQTNGAALLGRASPGRSSEIKARFPNGMKLTVLDGPQEADGLTWWQVEGEAGSGWSAGDFLRLDDE